MYAQPFPHTVFILPIQLKERAEPASHAGGQLAGPRSRRYGVLIVAVPPVSAPVPTSKVSVNDARPARADVNPPSPSEYSGNVSSTSREATSSLITPAC